MSFQARPDTLRVLHRRLVVWLALVSMLALALLPSVSHALTFARGGTGAWVEVCTPQGMRWVALPADELSAQPGPAPAELQLAGLLEHCPLCTLAHDTPAPPPAAAAPWLLPAGPQALPWLFLHAPRTLHAWRSAQPRGPPQHLS